MGAFDKILSGMRLSDDDYYDEDEEFDEDYDDFDDEDDEVEEKRPKKHSLLKRSGSKANTRDDDEDEADSNVSPISSAKPAKRSAKGLEVCVIKPASFADSREIVETLLSGKPVVLNMEGIDLGLAQRIIDVSSGACIAINGSLQKISSYIFIITPSSVDISGDLAGIMESVDFSGLQTGGF